MCWFYFISKNENINGFGTIGLNFLFLTKSVWRIFALLLYFALFSLVGFGLDWMRNLHNEHYLAARIGTFHVNMRGRLCFE